MFMHIFIHYTAIADYTANGLTKIDGINLNFPQKNITCTLYSTYSIAVLSFIVQWAGV